MKGCISFVFVLILTVPSFGSRVKRGDDVSADHVELARLASQVTVLQAQLTAQAQQIQDIKTERAQRVAFAAYISQEPSLTASKGAIVKFAGVLTNVGSAFNPATSVFTAPLDGVYMFFVHVDVTRDCPGVELHLHAAARAYANNDGRDMTHVSLGVALTLTAGDVVSVTFSASVGKVDAGRESVFTGFKLP